MKHEWKTSKTARWDNNLLLTADLLHCGLFNMLQVDGFIEGIIIKQIVLKFSVLNELPISKHLGTKIHKWIFFYPNLTFFISSTPVFLKLK